MIPAKIEEFKSCIEKESYYEAHEVLEALWFPRRFENVHEVQLLKGFINAAVSFELKKRGRIAQSKRVWRNYLKYRQLLLRLETPHLNIYYQLSRYLESLYQKTH